MIQTTGGGGDRAKDYPQDKQGYPDLPEAFTWLDFKGGGDMPEQAQAVKAGEEYKSFYNQADDDNARCPGAENFFRNSTSIKYAYSKEEGYGSNSDGEQGHVLPAEQEYP